MIFGCYLLHVLLCQVAIVEYAMGYLVQHATNYLVRDEGDRERVRHRMEVEWKGLSKVLTVDT
jgi:cell division protein FtsL